MASKPQIFCVDFDGTIVEHRFPDIGPIVPGALESLRRLQRHGKVILWTMRSGEHLSAAIDFLEDHGIRLWGVNENPDQSVWTNSPKAYGHVYIDDAAVGCPLVQVNGQRPYVDWVAVMGELGVGNESDKSPLQ